MLLPFKLGLGGYIGRGEQYFSWIHLEDMLRGLVHLITNQDCHGIYNFTAPNPVTNYQYSHELARALKRPCLFKIPERLLRATMGESADLLLYGQRVLPTRLLESGYEFIFPDISQALDCLRK